MAVSRVKLPPIRRGDPRTITVTIKSDQGELIDLSESTWTSTFRELANSTTSIPLTVDSTQAAVGVLGLHLSGEQSRTLGNTFVGDLQGSTFGTVLEFYGIVKEDVTHPGDEPDSGFIDNIVITWGGQGSTLSSSVLAILVPNGRVMSINGEIGTVVLTAADVGAATPASVTAAINSLIAAAPGALDTLNELAAALGNDPNFATTLTNALALKAPLASPALTGSPTVGGVAVETTTGAQTKATAAQTAAATDATSKVAAEAALRASADALLAPLASPALTGTPTVEGVAVETTSGSAAKVATETTRATTAEALEVTNRNAAIATHAAATDPHGDRAFATGIVNTEATNRNTAISTAINALINSAPAALDTLNELAAALGNDPNFATTITNALALKAPLASPALTGTPTSNGTAIETTTGSAAKVATHTSASDPHGDRAFTTAAINSLIAAAPGALDTLNELAAALGNDPNYATTITNALAGKAPIAVQATAPTATGNGFLWYDTSDNSTSTTSLTPVQIAADSGAQSVLDSRYAPIHSPLVNALIFGGI